MKKEFEILTVTRRNILKLVQGLSDEQLLKMPEGFNNNILWNMGHVVSSGQKLTYGLSGIASKISDTEMGIFAKGTSPKQWTSIPDIKAIKEYLSSTPVWLEEDYQNSIFKEYKEYETSYGFTIRNVEEAITFGNVHEAVHLGAIMALKKLV